MNYAAIIKERVSSREMMEALGVSVDRRGMAKCPFHADGDASLKVYSDPRRGWHCYGCSVGGDSLDFVRLWHGVGLTEAIRITDDMFSLGLPLTRKATDEERRAMSREIKRNQEKQDAIRRRRRAAEAVYWAAYDKWLANERIIAEEAPGSPKEPMSEAYIYAVTHSAEIREALEIAGEEWRLAREERSA